MKYKDLLKVIQRYDSLVDPEGESLLWISTPLETIDNDQVVWPVELHYRIARGKVYQLEVPRFDDFCRIVDLFSDKVALEKEILVNYYLQLEYFTEHIEPALKKHGFQVLETGLLRSGFPPTLEYGDAEEQISYLLLEYDVIQGKLFSDDRGKFRYIEDPDFLEYMEKEIERLKR